MKNSKIGSVVTIVALLVPGLIAQDFSACDPHLPCNPRPTTFAEALQAHGIDTSYPSLIAALKNSDPVVRSLAAHELAEKHDYSDKAAIENALSLETNSSAKAGIASALVAMGDRVGANALESMCTDASLPVEDLVRVTQQIEAGQRSHPTLLSAGRCAEAVLGALDHASEEWEKRQLVSVLPPMVKDVPREQADRMAAEAESLLSAKDPSTRLSASEALGEMGSTASIPALRAAIQNEPDPNIRAWHQRNLDKLLKLQQAEP